MSTGLPLTLYSRLNTAGAPSAGHTGVLPLHVPRPSWPHHTHTLFPHCTQCMRRSLGSTPLQGRLVSTLLPPHRVIGCAESQRLHDHRAARKKIKGQDQRCRSIGSSSIHQSSASYSSSDSTSHRQLMESAITVPIRSSCSAVNSSRSSSTTIDGMDET